MRTKALFLAALFTAATCATSMAQVYSANAVGYVNITLQAGFNIISNPLNGSPDNLLGTVLPLPDTARLSAIYRFQPDTQTYGPLVRFLGTANGWSDKTVELSPGQAVFIDVVAAAAPLNLTWVGEVPQGQQDVDLTGGGYNLVSSIIPQALPLGPAVAGEDTLEFPAAIGDNVLFFKNDGINPPTFGSANRYQTVGGTDRWIGPDCPTAAGPVPAVGGGFFVLKGGGNVTWARNFSVN